MTTVSGSEISAFQSPGIDIGADVLQRIDVGLAHGDDLALQPNLHAVKRHVIGIAVLYLQPGQFRHGLEMRDQRRDRILRAGDRAVDALARQKQRALDATLRTEGGKRRAQLREALEPAEAVERGDAEGPGFCCQIHAERV